MKVLDLWGGCTLFLGSVRVGLVPWGGGRRSKKSRG